MKKCPPDVAALLLEILARGLLRVRNAGYTGRADVAGVEADHLHNIPGLIADFTAQGLRFYWHAERPLLVGRSAERLDDPLVGFADLWVRLEPLVERICGPEGWP